MKPKSTDSKKTIFKSGKKAEKEKWSGLNKKEDEIVSSLLMDMEYLSKIYLSFILNEKDEVKTAVQKRKSLLKELDLLRTQFYLLTSYCKVIKTIRSSQTQIKKGRKVDIRERLIILILIIKFHKGSKRFPSGVNLYERFNKTVLDRNTEITFENQHDEEMHKKSDSRKKFQPIKPITTSVRMCSVVLREIKSILTKHPDFLEVLESSFSLDESLVNIMKD